MFHFEIYIKMSRRDVSQTDTEWVNYAALNSSAQELEVCLGSFFLFFLTSKVSILVTLLFFFFAPPV